MLTHGASLSLLHESGTAGSYPFVRRAYVALHDAVEQAETSPARLAVSKTSLDTGNRQLEGTADAFIRSNAEASRVSQPALAAIEDLRAWLGISYEDAAGITGLSSPSLIYHWRQRAAAGHPVRPRPTTVERLYRVHALVRVVAIALDGEDGIRGVLSWAHSKGADERTPLDLLRQGRLEAVHARVRGFVFDPSPNPVPDWRLARPGDDHDEEFETTQPRMRFGPNAFE
jgi:hypothetical protein